MMSMRFFRLAAFFLLQCAFAANLFGQDPNLANQYFTDGEYEKAASLYEQLSESDPRSEYYFNRYVDCLLNLERYDESEKVVKKQLKRTPDNANIYVVYGNIFDRQGKTDEAKEQYTKAVNAVADVASTSLGADTTRVVVAPPGSAQSFIAGPVHPASSTSKESGASPSTRISQRAFMRSSSSDRTQLCPAAAPGNRRFGQCRKRR